MHCLHACECLYVASLLCPANVSLQSPAVPLTLFLLCLLQCSLCHDGRECDINVLLRAEHSIVSSVPCPVGLLAKSYLLHKEVSVMSVETYHNELLLPNAFYKLSDMII